MAAHTKEQWSLVGAKIYSQGMPGKDARRVGEYVHYEDAGEAVALHNACIEAGIENPAAIPGVVKAVLAALMQYENMIEARTVNTHARAVYTALTKALDALNGRR